MIKYMKDNYGNRPGINEADHQELNFMRSEVEKLKQKLKQKTQSTNSAGNDESYGSESEGELTELPVKLSTGPTTGPRMSVSAEVFGRFNLEKEFKPPVHEKTDSQCDAIKLRMKNNFMFSSLNPKDSKAILQAIVPVKKAAGETIIMQGDDGDNFYLVESGELTCSKMMNPDDKQDTFLKTYVPGESFGELALLYNAPRAATIVAKTDSELWSLERATFNAIIKTAVQKKREKYDEFLENVEILKMCEHNEKEKIADAFKEEWYETGDTIIHQGDNAENSSFYMIIEGICSATMVMQPGTPATKVKTYNPGDYFGERSLLKDVPRAANIVAETQVCVVSLDRQSFKRLMGPMEKILARNEEEYEKFA